MSQPPDSSSKDSLVVGYQPQTAWSALSGPAGAALTIWASVVIAFGVSVLAIFLICIFVDLLQAAKHDQDFGVGAVASSVMLALASVGICGLIIYRGKTLLRVGRRLLSKEMVPLESAIISTNAMEGLFYIAGGFSLILFYGARNAFDALVGIGISASLLVVACGLSYTRKLLRRLQRSQHISYAPRKLYRWGKLRQSSEEAVPDSKPDPPSDNSVR